LREHGIQLKSRKEVLEYADDLPVRTALAVYTYPTGIDPAFSDCRDCYIFLNDCDYGDEVTYMVACHEIGHIVTREQTSMYKKFLRHIRYDPRDELESENMAWEWAQGHMLEWTPKQRQWKMFALNTYVQNESISEFFMEE
jgi:hypothetical protein